MPEKIEYIIWKYLDGQLTESEKLEFESKIELNQNLTQLLEQATLVHNKLNLQQIEKAPSTIHSNVLAKIQSERNFKVAGLGITPIFIFLGSLISLLLIGSNLTGSNNVFISDLLEKTIFSSISEIELTFPIPGIYASYILIGLCVIPLLYAIDQSIQKRTRQGFHLLSI